MTLVASSCVVNSAANKTPLAPMPVRDGERQAIIIFLQLISTLEIEFLYTEYWASPVLEKTSRHTGRYWNRLLEFDESPASNLNKIFYTMWVQYPIASSTFDRSEKLVIFHHSTFKKERMTGTSIDDTKWTWCSSRYNLSYYIIYAWFTHHKSLSRQARR